MLDHAIAGDIFLFAVFCRFYLMYIEINNFDNHLIPLKNP